MESKSEPNKTENEPDIKKIMEFFSSMKSKKVEKIIREILRNENVTIPEIVENTKIPRSTINRYISDLKEKEIIKREGTSRNGKWIVSKKILGED